VSSSSTFRISACVPCFNNAATLGDALDSINSQTVAVAELIVVDDGSTDSSAAIAEARGARVVRLVSNQGRGAARARGVVEASMPFVLFLDARGALPANFIAVMERWFADPAVAAVCTRVDDPAPQGVVRRWRARHLFRTRAHSEVRHRASLTTGASMFRRDAVVRAGNFDPELHRREDADLGRRLIAYGYDIVFDPEPAMVSAAGNTLSEVLERHWRWNLDESERTSAAHYAKTVWYSVTVMVRQDLRARDVAAALISLLAPHYSFWRTFVNRHPALRSAQ
jgi:glycosyltransferase involved in cell wall biosynthesis